MAALAAADVRRERELGWRAARTTTYRRPALQHDAVRVQPPRPALRQRTQRCDCPSRSRLLRLHGDAGGSSAGGTAVQNGCWQTGAADLSDGAGKGAGAATRDVRLIDAERHLELAAPVARCSAAWVAIAANDRRLAMRTRRHGRVGSHVELDEAVVLRAAAAGYQLRADAGGQPERDREPAATRCRSTAVETAAPPCNHPRPSPSPLSCVRWNRVSRERSGTSNEDGRARVASDPRRRPVDLRPPAG